MVNIISALRLGKTLSQRFVCIWPRHFSSQPAQFDGEAAEIYQRIFELHLHPKGPWKMMQDAVHALNLPAGATLLDLATGPGEPGTMIARNRPDMNVILSDISEDMLIKAKERAADCSNVICKQEDMQSLSFDDHSIDAVTCCYGLMFPEDIQLAFNEINRVLKPGGTLIMTHWQSLGMIQLSKSVMKAIIGRDPPPPPIDPLALSDSVLVPFYIAQVGSGDEHEQRMMMISQMASTYPFELGTQGSLSLTINLVRIQNMYCNDDDVMMMMVMTIMSILISPSPLCFVLFLFLFIYSTSSISFSTFHCTILIIITYSI